MSQKYLHKFICIVFLSLLIGGCFGSRFAKVTVIVIDEDNNPIPEASVSVFFEENTSDTTIENKKAGKANTQGRFTASGSGNGHVGIKVEHPGFYRSREIYDFTKKGIFFWEPANPEIKVLLRKIEKPVPMYARDSRFTDLKLPTMNQNVGFDLIEFDWVPPYGKGIHSDFIFNLQRSIIDKENYKETLHLTFVNNLDGIQIVDGNAFSQSSYKLSRYALEDGYVDKFESVRGRDHGKYYESFSLNDNFLFRVRSGLDSNGEVQAIYGKIHGPVFIDGPFSKSLLRFKYYLNPDFSRNLEFNRDRNLSKGMSRSEKASVF